MTQKTYLLLQLFLSSLAVFFFSIARAQGRAPHGLANENPMAFSPSAVDFFHPKTKEPSTTHPCDASSSGCAPLPMAAKVEATQAQESKFDTTPDRHAGNGIGAGGGVGIVLGSALVMLLAMGAYHVTATRRANANRDNSVETKA